MPVQMQIYSLEMPLFSVFAPCLRESLGAELSNSFPLIAVKDKSFIKFSYIAEIDAVYFREPLQCHKHFMMHVKNCLLGTANLLRGIVNSIALKGVPDYFASCFCREMVV